MDDKQTPAEPNPVETVELEHEPLSDREGWFEEPETLPRRPRRLLRPLPVSLLCILLTACGFIGGVLVEKGQAGSSSTGGLGEGARASRFAALRAAASGSPAGATGGTSSGASAPSPFGSGGSTVGQVSFIKGSTLYVTDSEGNTIKVRTSPASTVTKTATSKVGAIHPGEEAVVAGSTAADGTVTAESIRVGGTGGGFGAPPGATTGAGSSTSSGGASGPALFGNG